ncbi:MAG TPA: L-aspartate oxidase [Nocardioidaceae bacterium]|nr:L-aspartate oxidase [Nocardioidaceae bacterium]
MTPTEVDVLVVGAGVAGLSVALGVAPAHRVLVLSAGPGSTGWAQGGIAAVTEAADRTENHAADTVAAGAGRCADLAVGTLVDEGPGRVAELLALGARLDREPDGRLSRTVEGGHHHRRVVHAGGDATGAEVARALADRVAAAGVPVLDATVMALTTGAGRHGPQVTGVRARYDGAEHLIRARAVVLATGGIGHAYPASTNPAAVTGAGIALALAAGASLVDVEFVQFHPTVLWTGARQGQLPLVSEALRGEGAVLRDAAGRRIMAGLHPLADLAPRDVVARAIDAATRDAGAEHVWLDATGLDRALLRRRFPTIRAACAGIGVDPARDLIPVAPAEHFLCGGVRTDRWGATDVPGLFAVGETAATGVHGANRLASNSLLEGLVYGRRAAARLVLDLPDAAGDELPPALVPTVVPGAEEIARQILGEHAGVRRDGDGLARAAARLDQLLTTGGEPAGTTWTVARAVVAAATARQESRGCHWRADHPHTRGWWARPVVVRQAPSGHVLADVEDPKTAA